MKTLYVVRHAKSSWEYHELPDMDRPLKGRGIRDAHLMASWLQDLLTTAPVLYSSPSTRTLHTAMIFARTLGIPLDEVRVAESLYSASHLDIAAFLRGIQGEPGSIMLFGHNPGMSEFITDCVPGFTENLPTGGVAVLQFEISSWNDLRSEAELRYFDFPKNQKN
jgi:phosphohistidine phosphatase